MENFLEAAKIHSQTAFDFALAWIIDPANWVQFALLVGSYLAAVFLTRTLNPKVSKLLTPPEGSESILAKVRRFVLIFLPLILPMLAFGFTAIGEQVTRSLFGSGDYRVNIYSKYIVNRRYNKTCAC